MKKLLLLTLMLILANAAASQEFAPLGAKWHFSNCYYMIGEPLTYSVIEVVADTIIDEKYSTVIHLYKDNGVEFVTDLIVHEDQGRIYFYEFGEFKLFFDYNIKVGDTLAFQVPVNAPAFQSNCGSEGVEYERVYYALVDSIAILEADGVELSEFHTSKIIPEDYDGSYHFWLLEVFRQRIGSPTGLFGQSAVEDLGGFPGFYRCYEDDEISINFSATLPCDYTTVNVFEPEEKLAISVYPNPVKDFIRIELKGDHCSWIEIMDLNGKTIKTKSIKGFYEVELDISGIPSGTYILKTRCEGNRKHHSKFIKL